MFGRRGSVVTRDTIAAVVRQRGTPVCVRIDGQVGKDTLAWLAARSSAFLMDWRQAARTMFLQMHNDHPHHRIFLDGRSVADGEHVAFLAALGEAGVHGCIIQYVSNTFLKQCRKTGRFVFVAFDAALSTEVLPQTIDRLLGKAPLYSGHGNVGGAVDIRHARIFPALEQCAHAFPLFISCAPKDWRVYSSMMQGMVTVAPGMRLVGLSTPPANGGDGWRDEFTVATYQLAYTLQGAIANTPAIP